MFDTIRFCFTLFVLVIAATLSMRPAAIAEDAIWRVAKSSGEVLLIAGERGSTPGEGALIRPGDSVRTGQTGQVLLKRGLETILVSPNSAFGLAAEDKSKFWTTVVQQAGSLLLEVEKRNVKHFAVETPNLTAIVKGTKFRVSVDRVDSRVDVFRGQVEVHDLKSGQYAMVDPNQAAMVSARQEGAGLFLSGSGSLNPIQQGIPRSPSVTSAQTGDGRLMDGSSTWRPVRIASAPMTIPVTTFMPPLSSYLQPDWSSKLVAYVTSFLKSKSSGYENHREDLELAIAVACVAFFAVSIFVAMQQRRRQAKKKVIKA